MYNCICTNNCGMGLSSCKFWILLVGCKYEINNMSALQHTKAQLDIHNAPRHASSYVYTNKEHCLIDTVHTCTRITQILVFLPKVWKLGNYYSVEYVNYLYMKLHWTLQQHESLYWNDSSTQVLISSLFCTQYKLSVQLTCSPIHIGPTYNSHFSMCAFDAKYSSTIYKLFL